KPAGATVLSGSVESAFGQPSLNLSLLEDLVLLAERWMSQGNSGGSEGSPPSMRRKRCLGKP
ncbi:MAG: hypothetical protein ACKN9U_25865, partial [Pirellulaceae bacterium]